MLGLLLVMRVPVRSTQVNDTHQQQCMGCILAFGTIHASCKQAGISLLLDRETLVCLMLTSHTTWNPT